MTNQRTNSSDQLRTDTIPQAILRRQGRSRDRRENLTRSQEIKRGWHNVIGKVALGSAVLGVGASVVGEALDNSHNQSVKQALDNQEAHTRVVEHTEHELAKDGIVLSDGTTATVAVPTATETVPPTEVAPTAYPPEDTAATVATSPEGVTGGVSGEGITDPSQVQEAQGGSGGVSPTEG